MRYVCATYVSLLCSVCDVLGVLGIFCGVPRKSFNVSIYVNVLAINVFFRSHGSDVSHGPVCRAGFFQDYARSIRELSVHVISRLGWGAWGCFPLPLGFFLQC